MTALVEGTGLRLLLREGSCSDDIIKERECVLERIKGNKKKKKKEKKQQQNLEGNQGESGMDEMK